MSQEENNKDPQEASKKEVLTRRGAIKRIAAGIAGIGIVVAAGHLFNDRDQVQAKESLQEERPLPGQKPPYGD